MIEKRTITIFLLSLFLLLASVSGRHIRGKSDLNRKLAHHEKVYHHGPQKGQKKASTTTHHSTEEESYEEEVVHIYKVSKSGKKGKKGGKKYQNPKEEQENYGEDEYDGDDEFVSGKGSKNGGKGKVGEGTNKHPKKYHKRGGDHTLEPSHGSSPSNSQSPTESSEPTASPIESPNVITPSPTNAGSVAIDLSPYALEYELVDFQLPGQKDLNELGDLTRLYLEEFFFMQYSKSSFTFLDDFVTRVEESSHIRDMQIQVDYTSTARFNSFTTIFPSKIQLDEDVAIAFDATNLPTYETRLDDLPEGNVFKGALVFVQGDPVLKIEERTKGTLIAASVVAFALLAMATVLYKRRSREDEADGKNLSHKAQSDSTIAGETYAGDTYDSTATYDGSASADTVSIEHGKNQQGEEDGGMKMSNLGTIQESAIDSFVKHNWGGTQMYGKKPADYAQTKKGQAKNGVNKRTIVSGTTRNFIGSASSRPTATEDTGNEGHHFDKIALQMPSHENDENNVARSFKDESKRGYSMKAFSSLFAGQKSHENRSIPQSDISDGESSLSIDPSIASDDLTTHSPRRPHTVAEIEAMLSADMDAESESHCDDNTVSSSGSSDSNSIATPLESPRTVAEIESLLSADLDDDISISSSQSNEI